MLQFIKAGSISPVIDEFTRTHFELPRNRWLSLNEIFAFVRDDIRYVPDPQSVERVCGPEYTLQIGAGDCDDKVVLLNSMLENIGFKTRVHAVGFGPIGQFSHVISDVRWGNGWLPLDPCVPNAGPGWRPPGVTCHRVKTSGRG
jgi:transglutaminase-like putative cysteine protease